MKKFNEYRNIIGTLVKEHREQKTYQNWTFSQIRIIRHWTW